MRLVNLMTIIRSRRLMLVRVTVRGLQIVGMLPPLITTPPVTLSLEVGVEEGFIKEASLADLSTHLMLEVDIPGEGMLVEALEVTGAMAVDILVGLILVEVEVIRAVNLTYSCPRRLGPGSMRIIGVSTAVKLDIAVRIAGVKHP
jgi:hypothetical protein